MSTCIHSLRRPVHSLSARLCQKSLLNTDRFLRPFVTLSRPDIMITVRPATLTLSLSACPSVCLYLCFSISPVPVCCSPSLSFSSLLRTVHESSQVSSLTAIIFTRHARQYIYIPACVKTCSANNELMLHCFDAKTFSAASLRGCRIVDE